MIIDASVAFKWLVNEEYSDEAFALKNQRMYAPDLIILECNNALWVKYKRGLLSKEEVRERFDLLTNIPVELTPQTALMKDAMELALRLNHPMYDCLYLALAKRKNMPLLTADKKFYAIGKNAWAGMRMLGE